MPKEYLLLLPNDMTVYITRQDYDKYEVNHYYEFELDERATISYEIKIKSD